MMWWYGGHGPGWVGWLIMSLTMVVFWGVLVWGIVSFVRWSGRSSSDTQGHPQETPEQVLARRFASGESSSDEYRAALDTLKGTPPVGV